MHHNKYEYSDVILMNKHITMSKEEKTYYVVQIEVKAAIMQRRPHMHEHGIEELPRHQGAGTDRQKLSHAGILSEQVMQNHEHLRTLPEGGSFSGFS